MTHFETLARQAQEDPASADFVALRKAYMASKHYHPTSHFSASKLMGNTNTLQSFEEVVSFCQKVLQNNPMDLEAWLLMEYAYERLEQADAAARAHQFILGMLSAILQSGDGKSPETAWQVVAVAEEYTLITVMGYQPQRQQLLELDGQFFDRLMCVKRATPDEGVTEFYFNITKPFNYLQTLMG